MPSFTLQLLPDTTTGPRKVQYQSGKYEFFLTFDTAEQFQRWKLEVEDIKDHIAEINNDGNSEAKRARKYKGWLKNVKAFIENHGESHLPPDIKWAVNNVENGIGVQPTVWADPPENHLRGQRNGGVTET